METNFIAIIRPNIPKINNFRRLLNGIIHNFEHRLVEHDLEAGQHLLESYHGQFRLEKISAV